MKNLILILLCLGLVLSCDKTKKELLTEKDGYEWYKVSTRSGLLSKKYGAPYGAESITGTPIIPIVYDTIFYNIAIGCRPRHFTVRQGECRGIYSINGECIISPAKGYEFVFYTHNHTENNKTYIVQKGKYFGIIEENGNEIIPLNRKYTFATAICDIYSDNSYRTLYYKVSKGDNKGICDVNGTEIISPDMGYKYIDPEFTGKRKELDNAYYIVHSKMPGDETDKYGVCDPSGKEIILPNKYSYINLYKDNHIYFRVRYDNYYGICDEFGDEIIPINKKYKKITLLNTHGKSDSDYFKVYKKGYKGLYDATGREIISIDMCCTDISYIEDGLFNIKQDGSYREYEDPQKQHTESSYDPWRNLWYGSSNSGMIIGNSNNYSNSSETSTSSATGANSSNKPKECYSCHGWGTCQTCNGKGWYYGFGYNQVSCPNCDRNHNGKCSTCHGSGKIY